MNEQLYDPKKELELLQKVESGEISAEDALKRLGTIRDDLFDGPEVDPGSERDDSSLEDARVDNAAQGLTMREQHSDESAFRRFSRLNRWWILPYTVGVILTTIGSIWLFLGWNNGQFGFGFWLAWIPFLLGVLLMSLSWRARASHWLHLRVRQRPGKRPSVISISIPLPFGFIKWASRNFGQYFPPEIRGIDLDELIDEMDASISSDNPIYIWVNDEKEGQQVEIWIGGGNLST